MENKEIISVKTLINAPIIKVWNFWTEPKHIMNWNNASEDWHTPYSTNDLKVGGKFSYTMASKDGSMSFDFGGTYNEVIPMKKIVYTLDDDRKVTINFENSNNQVEITEIFEAENQNPKEIQQQGWQAILDSFKKYVDSN